MRTFQYQSSVTTHEELRDVYDYTAQILGSDIISYEQFSEMQKINKNISHNVQIIDDEATSKIKGFLSFSFLTKEAVDGLQKQTLTTMQLSGEHQVSEDDRPAAIYIGAVGACPKDMNARIHTMRYFFKTVSAYKENYDCAIMARPVSDIGMKITSSLKLKPMHEQAGLGALYIGR